MSSSHHRVCCCSDEQSEPRPECGCRCGDVDTECCYQFGNVGTGPTVEVTGTMYVAGLTSNDGSCGGDVKLLLGYPYIKLNAMSLTHHADFDGELVFPFTHTGRCGTFSAHSKGTGDVQFSNKHPDQAGHELLDAPAGAFSVLASCFIVTVNDDTQPELIPFEDDFEWRIGVRLNAAFPPGDEPVFDAAQADIGYPSHRLGGGNITMTSNPHDVGGAFKCEAATIGFVNCRSGEPIPSDPTVRSDDRISDVQLTLDVIGNSCCWDGTKCAEGAPSGDSGVCPP